MSFPNIPNICPDIDLDINDVVSLLLVSIAFEELGLAHIINAEAEKIQSILGTLDGQNAYANPTLDDLITIDNSVDRTLRNVIKKEILLEFKFENILQISTSTTSTTSSTTSTTSSTSSTTSSTSSTSSTTSSTSSTSSTTSSTSSTSSTTSTTSSTTSSTSSTTSTTSSTTSSTSSTTSTTSSTSSTTTTTTTTTSTSSTSSTTTCNPCLTGSGTGTLSVLCDPRFNEFNILDPRINASCCEPDNTDPDNIQFRAQLIPSPGGTQSLELTANTGTLSFICAGNTLTITGTGSARLRLSDGTDKTGAVTFTYTFVDNGPTGNQDDIGIVITGVLDPDLSFTTCGLRDLTGNITVGTCS